MDSNEELIRNLKMSSLRSDEVENALRNIPREHFVPEQYKSEAYKDYPLQIGYGQTISQPYTVVMMTELLEVKPGHKVLEIGAGSGWQSALLGHIVGKEGKVYTVESVKELAELAKKNISKTGINNVEVVVGDGSGGLEKEAPFDRIIVTAAAPKIPRDLEEQLSVGGKLVAPIGGMFGQRLIVSEKKENFIKRIVSPGHYRFVPLTGKNGFKK